MSDEYIFVELRGRDSEIDTWVQECADKKLSFAELCRRVSVKGYSTRSLYEMVRSREK